jgi:hypothetical protein
LKRSLAIAGFTALAAVPAVSMAEDAPAAPAAAAAPAAPLTPLGKLLDASGITASGYFDVAYSHATRNIETGFSNRVFDSQNDSIALHQFGLQIAKQPKEGFGGLVNITAGKDVTVFESYPYYGTNNQFDVTQAYGQYASGALTVIAGKFGTLQGSEVIWAPTNSNFSRSMLFGAIPFTHTGVRLSYAADDTATLMVGVNNGWDQVTDANKSKTLELGVTLTPIKPLSITLSDYVGKESAAPGGATPTAVLGTSAPQGTRNSLNLVATYTVIDPLTIGAEYLNVSQNGVPANGSGIAGAATATAGSTIKAKYSGYALYATYMVTPAWRLALRGEVLDDKDGFHYMNGNAKYTEGTLTLSWLPSDSFELRGEVREDHANTAVFSDFSTTPAMGKGLSTFALEGLFKF